MNYWNKHSGEQYPCKIKKVHASEDYASVTFQIEWCNEDGKSVSREVDSRYLQLDETFLPEVVSESYHYKVVNQKDKLIKAQSQRIEELTMAVINALNK